MAESLGDASRGAGPLAWPLIHRAILISSHPNDAVLEPFLGSGSTLIATERTGRACLAIEPDPRHCDVALARWEAFTGLVAERVDG